MCLDIDFNLDIGFASNIHIASVYILFRISELYLFIYIRECFLSFSYIYLIFVRTVKLFLIQFFD